jgi:hypothetical protein
VAADVVIRNTKIRSFDSRVQELRVQLLKQGTDFDKRSKSATLSGSVDMLTFYFRTRARLLSRLSTFAERTTCSEFLLIGPSTKVMGASSAFSRSSTLMCAILMHHFDKACSLLSRQWAHCRPCPCQRTSSNRKNLSKDPMANSLRASVLSEAINMV